MNIPEGFKVVPIVPTEEMISAGQDQEWTEDVYAAMLTAATAPSQPIFDEAKERELFNAWYGELPTTKLKETMWMAWEACAQSRAKAGEDDQ